MRAYLEARSTDEGLGEVREHLHVAARTNDNNTRQYTHISTRATCCIRRVYLAPSNVRELGSFGGDVLDIGIDEARRHIAARLIGNLDRHDDNSRSYNTQSRAPTPPSSTPRVRERPRAIHFSQSPSSRVSVRRRRRRRRYLCCVCEYRVRYARSLRALFRCRFLSRGTRRGFDSSARISAIRSVARLLAHRSIDRRCWFVWFGLVWFGSRGTKEGMNEDCLTPSFVIEEDHDFQSALGLRSQLRTSTSSSFASQAMLVWLDVERKLEAEFNVRSLMLLSRASIHRLLDWLVDWLVDWLIVVAANSTRFVQGAVEEVDAQRRWRQAQCQDVCH
mgnify:CR=1 FL=1